MATYFPVLVLLLLYGVATYHLEGNVVPYSMLHTTSEALSHVYSVTFSEDEKRCLNFGPEFFYNGSCTSLLDQASCPDMHLLVVDKKMALSVSEPQLKPVCKRYPCPPSYGYVAEHRKCFHLEDITHIFCSAGTAAVKNIFGEVQCQCEYDFSRLVGDEDSQCYPLLTRGPCSPGDVLVPVGTGMAACSLDYCTQNVSEPNNRRVAVLFENGGATCYDLRAHGPCGNRAYLAYKEVVPGIFALQCLNIYVPATESIPEDVLVIPAVSTKCVINNKGECVKLLHPLEQPFFDPSDFEE